MYSPKIIDLRQRELESTLAIQLHRYSPAECEAWAEHLDRRREKIAARERLKVEEVSRRYFSDEERAFMRNETLLCSIDFSYWRQRYCFLIADPDLGRGVGLQRMNLTEGQQILFNKICSEEEIQIDRESRGEIADGILIACDKTRQHGGTMLARAIIVHRVTTQQHTRAISGSIDDEKVMKIYERDLRILDHLPFWLKPTIGFEEKAGHIVFSKLDSSILYQELVQKAGIGQGEQNDIGHFSEVASVPYFAISLENDYQPTIPRSARSLHILETTPLGRDGWWRFFIDDIRKGGRRWKLCALPWWASPSKYRLTPPADWQPSELAMIVAQKIYEHSEEYIGKPNLYIPKNSLYWWEKTQDEARRSNSLQWFYTNYWTTIEEGFQATTDSVFSQELIEFFHSQVRGAIPYEVNTQ